MKRFLRKLFNIDHVINCKDCNLELSRNNTVVNSYHFEQRDLNHKGEYLCKKCSEETNNRLEEKGLVTTREPEYNKTRARKTIDFCDIPKHSIVLDIAALNTLSKQLSIEKRVIIINTVSDLDYEIIPEQKHLFKYVTCFEVIEHLLNPRMFFDNLHKITDKDVILYLSYPSRPKFLWNDEQHFHEYDKLRFEYLLKKTNWKIIKRKKIYVRRFPNGIRPIIRNFIPQTLIFKIIKT